MTTHLIIDGNAVYEIDEECCSKRSQSGRNNDRKKETEERMRYQKCRKDQQGDKKNR